MGKLTYDRMGKQEQRTSAYQVKQKDSAAWIRS